MRLAPRLLAIDPGETVGWAIFNLESGKKLEGGQTHWSSFAHELAEAFGLVTVLSGDTFGSDIRTAQQSTFYGVERIVMEDFLIYPPGVGPGPPPPWDPIITARLIGAIQLAADLAYVPVDYYGANIKDAAKAAGAELDFARPLHENRHENDATMHGTYWFARKGAGAAPRVQDR